MDELRSSLAPALQALVALVESEGHMTDAAAELGIPQSSMSRRVHALEDDLGVSLVVRDGRAVRLTPTARRLAGETAGPLRAIELATLAIASDVDPERGTVHFGFPLSLGAGAIPAALGKVRAERPGLTLALTQAHGARLVHELRTGSLDCAVVTPAPEGIDHQTLGEQSLRMHLPTDHPLARRRSIDIADLRGEPFIAPPPSFHLRRVLESRCREAGFEPTIAVEIPELLTIRGLVASGLGVALLPELGGDAGTVRTLDLTPALSRRVCFAWGPTGHTPATRVLGAAVIEAFRPDRQPGGTSCPHA